MTAVDDSRAKVSVTSVVRRSLRQAPRTTQLQLAAGIPFAVLIALFEGIGLALVLPYVQLLAEEDGELDSRFQRVVDIFGAESRSDVLALLAGLIVASLLFKTVLAAAVHWWQTGVVSKGEAIVATNLFARYMHAPYLFHIETNSAEAIRNVHMSITVVFRRVLLPLTSILSEFVLILTVLVVLVAVEPLLAVVSIVFFALVGVGYVFGLARLTSRLGSDNQRLAAEQLKTMQESLAGIKILKAGNAQQAPIDDYRKVRFEFEKVKHVTSYLGALPRFYIELMMLVGVALLGGLVMATHDGPDAFGILGLFIAGLIRLLPSLNRVLSATSLLRVGNQATTDLEEILAKFDALDGERDAAGDEPIPFTGELRFDGLTFGYPGAARPALEQVDVTIERGQSVGVVGPSGAGKTTLVDLVLGLVHPDAGQILVDGVALGPHNLASWRSQIAYVPQEVFLKDDTLRRNVALGVADEDIDDDLVREALRSAELDAVVADLPDGLDQRLGERGVRLSGGQRQRIGIARALYRRPQILVLDEATSALDGATEAAIAETVQNLRGDLTLMIIAHRLSTVRRCDNLVLLDAGRVAAVGSFAELQESNADFAELTRLAGMGAEVG